jgi:ubiquinone/menaquinone biosynthesis C-methylase UbiE
MKQGLNETYEQFAQYYDAYVKDFDEDLALYKSLCNTDEKILEVGCGTGRVLKSFLQDGFPITGVDISQAMLDVARTKLYEFYQDGRLRLALHNFLQQPLLENYAKVLVTFYTFNYILDDPETFLHNIFLTMSDRATLIMDLFYPKTLTHKALNNVWTTHAFPYQDRVITLKDKRTFSGEIEERIQIYQEPGKETQITTIRKYYPPQTIKQLLETVGFTEIRFAEQYDVSSFTEKIQTSEITRNFLVKAVKSLFPKSH